MSREYPVCPFCGHADYHKTFGCDDTCCAGCPTLIGDNECDCQYTVASIEREIERRRVKEHLDV